MIKQIFINLPIKDLKKTKTFFARLGFKFNPRFTDDKAACMIIGKNMYSMLIVEKFFKTFIKKKISDSKKSTEVLLALQVESRKKVDEMVKRALQAGAKEVRDPQDHGFMYARAFDDLDSHTWEIFFMDEKKFKNGK